MRLWSGPGFWITTRRTARSARPWGSSGSGQTFLVLREAFNGVRRFDDMQRRTAMPRQVLSERLARLVDEGLLRKVPYQDSGQRRRDEYRLTDKGLDLYPVLVALMAWGDQHAVGPEGPQVLLRHRDCGEPVQLHCPARPDTSSAQPAKSPPSPARAPARSPDGPRSAPDSSDPWSRGGRGRVSALIAIDGWRGWGALKDSSEPG